MSIEAFRLQNFMPFEDTGWIELKPICLLFGRNSSGKSAIIRALRLLKQSLKGESLETPFVFVDEYGVDLGSFENTVHTRDRKRTLSFSFRCTLERNLDILHSKINEARSCNGLSPVTLQEMTDRVEIKLSYVTGEESFYIWLKKVEIKTLLVNTSDVDDTILVFEAFFDPILVDHGLEEWQFVSEIFTGYDEDDNAFTGASIETTSGFLPELVVLDSYSKAERRSHSDLRILRSILIEINKSIKTFLESLNYLGPVRPRPQRIYTFDPITRLHWEKAGWRATIRFLEENVDQELFDRVIEWIKKFDLGIKIDVRSKRLKPGIISEVKMEDSEELSVNLVDTGYGVSQILPIIMACVLAQQNAQDMLVIIEQPELHLHPRAQAQIADLLIAIATRGEQLIEKRKAANETLPTKQELKALRVRFLIETHSEHLLLRLRHSIVHTTLSETRTKIGKEKQSDIESIPSFGTSQLRVYFTERVNSKSSVELIEIDRLGQYERQPDGFKRFFSDDYEQVMGITESLSQLIALEQGNASND